MKRFMSAISAAALMATLLMAALVAPVAATTGGQFDWGGNGWPNPSCRDAVAGGTDSALWIFTGKGVTNVVFHWDTGQTIAGTEMGGGGSWHMTVPFFDPSDPANQPIFVTYDGTLDGNAVLTLSGCNESKFPGAIATIVTTVHLNEDDTAGTVVVDNTATATAGSTVHDSAVLTWTSADPLPAGSNVVFYFFTNNTCTGEAADQSAAIDVGGETGEVDLDPNLAEGPLATGGYSYLAFFTSGDTSVVTHDSGDCEPFTIVDQPAAATAEISTEIHSGATDGTTPEVIALNSSVALGSDVHDSATIVTSPADVDLPASTVTFYFFAGDACGDPADAITWSSSNVSGSDRSVDPGLAALGLAAGSYSFMAVFTSGDTDVVGSDTSDCEPFSVDKGDVGISTTIHNAAHGAVTSVSLGDKVHDTADISGTVAGILPDLTKVSFTWFTNGTCANTGSPVSLDVAEGDTTAASVESAALSPGSYSYQASFAGDDNYNAAGPATCEPLTVNKGTLSIRTDIHNAAHQVVLSVIQGETVHDTATLSGVVSGYNPDLSKITFKWFTNGTCSGTGVAVGLGTAEDTLVARSVNSPTLTNPGSYSYQASFLGDNNYDPAGPATCEPLTVVGINGLTPGYWKNHLANSNSKGPFYSAECKTVAKSGGSCSTNGPWAIQYLPKTLGNYSVSTITNTALVFNAMNCSSTKDQDAIGCLAGHLLATKLNLANGSLACPGILQAVADADAFLKGQTVSGVPGINYIGPSGKYTLTAAQRNFVISLKTKLDRYNNNIACP